MRILYNVSTLKCSGPTNQLYNLIKYLDRSKFEPHLITLSPEPPDSRWKDYEALGVELHTLGLSRLEGELFSKKRLKSLVEAIAPDIIHTQGIRADMLNATALKDYPSLCTVRNYPFADYPTKFGKLRGTLMAQQHMSALRKINAIACSLAIQDQLKAHGVNADVVQNGIDTEKFHPAVGQRKKELCQKLGLPEDTLILLSVGSLIPRKNMKTLIDGFEQARMKNTNLVILGDGPQMSVLREQAGPSVLLPGNVSNVSEYLGAADLFLSTSLSEGLPNTVLEAMASGLPCLLSDIPSHRELFEGENDIFISCKDVDGLADRLKQINVDLLTEHGKISRQIVEERFNAQKMSTDYQKIYLELIGNQNG